MSRENLVQRVAEYLRDELAEDYVWELHNHYVRETECGDYVFDTCWELSKELSLDAEESMRALYFGKLHNWYDKCYLNGYGNIETATIDRVVDFYPMAEWYVDNRAVEFTTYLELGDNEWESEDQDIDLCDKEAMRRWVADGEDTEEDRKALYDELKDAEFYIIIHDVEIK